MANINFTPFPGLATERLILRQITDNDMKEFHILKSDERLLKYYGAKPRTYAESCLKLKSLKDEIATSESITWGIALKESNKIIGSICFWNISGEKAKAEIGYELMYEWQGRGIMQEAIKAIVNYGFNTMQLLYIEAVPDPENIKSVKLLENNNFTREEQFTEIDPLSGITSNRVLYLLKNPCLCCSGN